jgi:nucleoside-diphosphate-sugar epimerase
VVKEVENLMGQGAIPYTRRTAIERHEPGVLKSQASESATNDSFIIALDDRILVTGAAGFIGARVVESLLDRGFRNLLCFARPSSELEAIQTIVKRQPLGARIDLFRGNLLSRADCEIACKDATIIYHLAAGTGEKSFPDAFMNSVVTTRNLLEASLRWSRLRRFVLVSSFAVYTNRQKSRRLDESCPIEEHPELRGDAYCFAKVKQEQIVAEYGKKFGIPSVVVRPGSVYGEGKGEITGRVGLGTFGLFLHLGGPNTIPFTHVDNCAEAIILAGLVKGVDSEVFNVVDDDLPSSREFLQHYKKSVRRFKSVYVPHVASLGLCYLWEKYSQWSKGQMPNAFNRRRWHAEWKKTRYSNEKLKARLGWTPKVPTAEGLMSYFQSCAQSERYV